MKWKTALTAGLLSLLSFSASSQTLTKTGSAVAVNGNTLLTNRHVLQGCSYIVAHNDYQQSLQTSNIQTATNPNVDLGVAEFPNNTFPNAVSIQNSNSDPSLGDAMYTLGYPSGYSMGNSVRYSAGNISEVPLNSALFIHTASIDEGSSGSGAFSLANNSLIGLNTYLYKNNTPYGGAIKAQALTIFLNANKIPFNYSSAVPDQNSNVKSTFMVDCYENSQNSAPAQTQAQAIYYINAACHVSHIWPSSSSFWQELKPSQTDNITYRFTIFSEYALLTTYSQKTGITASYTLIGNGAENTDKDGYHYYSYSVPNSKLKGLIFGMLPNTGERGKGIVSYVKEQYSDRAFFSMCVSEAGKAE